MKPSPSTLIFQGGGDYTHFRGVVIGLNGDFLDFALFWGFWGGKRRGRFAAGGEAVVVHQRAPTVAMGANTES